jgi:probable phosphoglycerate mutase
VGAPGAAGSGRGERRPDILLVRHGETEWSAAGRHTSRTDLPLVEAGRARASVLGRELAGRSFALVLCSPLRRARETCSLAGFGEVAVVDDDLREWDYGEYEGLRTLEIRERRPDWWLWRDGCPGGEHPGEVAARADRALERLREAGGDAIAFAHGHILRVLAARWVGEEAAFGGRLLLGAGGLSVLGYERETPVLARWNLG